MRTAHCDLRSQYAMYRINVGPPPPDGNFASGRRGRPRSRPCASGRSCGNRSGRLGQLPARAGTPGWTLTRVEAASRRFLPRSKAARCRFYLGPSLCLGCSRITLPSARAGTPRLGAGQSRSGVSPLSPRPKAVRCRFYLGPSLCTGCSRITPPRARPSLRAVCARRGDAGLADQKWSRRRPRPRNIARDPSTGARRTYPSGIRENQVGAPGPGAQRTPDVATEIWSQVMWSMAIQPAWRRGPKGIVPTPLGVSFPLPAIALLKDRLRPVTVKPVSRQ